MESCDTVMTLVLLRRELSMMQHREDQIEDDIVQYERMIVAMNEEEFSAWCADTLSEYDMRSSVRDDAMLTRHLRTALLFQEAEKKLKVVMEKRGFLQGMVSMFEIYESRYLTEPLDLGYTITKK